MLRNNNPMNIKPFVCLLFFAISIQSQELQVLINEALMNNLDIKKWYIAHQIATEKVNEKSNIPNTQFGAGYFIREPETRTGAQRFRISVQQMIPWFGTITARKNYANALAETKYEAIVIAKRKLVLSVTELYYNLYELHTKQKIIQKNIKLLTTYENLALTSVATGKASAVDVLKLQIRQNDLKRLEKVVAQQYLSEQTKLNTLLNRNTSRSIRVITDLYIPLEEETILPKNIKIHPELIQYDKLYQSVSQLELLNKKENKPQIGLGFDYIAVSKRPNSIFNDNGKDIAMPSIKISIPIFNKKYRSKTKRNKLKQQEILLEKQKRWNELKKQLDIAIQKQTTAKINYNTQINNLKQTKYVEEIILKNYETKSIDFNEILDVQELQLTFENNKIKSIKNYYIQTAIINYLIKN